MKIACIVLSAGLSSRFGKPKALATINAIPLIDHLQRILLNTQLDEIIIVLGAEALSIKPYVLEHKRIKFVYNKDYNFGQTSSFKAGLQGIPTSTEGVMLLPIDCPFVKKETIDLLIRKFSTADIPFLIPTFQEKKGHPLLFQARFIKDFLTLENSMGLNTVAKQHLKQVLLVPVEDKGVIQSFNTPEEFNQFKKDLGNELI